MNSSRPFARCHSRGVEPLEVMALASCFANLDNAVHNIPDSESFLSSLGAKSENQKFLFTPF